MFKNDFIELAISRGWTKTEALEILAYYYNDLIKIITIEVYNETVILVNESTEIGA